MTTDQNSENIEMKRALQVKEYAADIRLFDAFEVEGKKLSIEQKEEIADKILLEIYDGVEQFKLSALKTYSEKRELLHGVINTLEPNTLSQEAITLLNSLLQSEVLNKRITNTDELLKLKGVEMGETPVKMWQGSISTLEIDAIVNAANSKLLGCWQPLHACTDNMIHTSAGVQLRDDCNTIMEKQGFEEPIGRAKITRAYNLPSKYVIHTVGPSVSGEVNALHEEDLANSYIHCLEMCKQIKDIRSIAFSCISTGEFGYPTKDAAQLAIRVVSLWLEKNPTALDLVVFNAFSNDEKDVYQEIFDKIQ